MTTNEFLKRTTPNYEQILCLFLNAVDHAKISPTNYLSANTSLKKAQLTWTYKILNFYIVAFQ